MIESGSAFFVHEKEKKKNHSATSQQKNYHIQTWPDRQMTQDSTGLEMTQGRTGPEIVGYFNVYPARFGGYFMNRENKHHHRAHQREM